MSEEFRRSLSMPVNMPLPFDTRNMLSINPQGTKTVNETYVPEHDILNVMPGAFVGMCTLIQNIDTEISTKTLNISEEDMLSAVKALRYILSRDGLSHGTIEEAYMASGLVDLPWQARTWVLKNLADVMLRIWHQAGAARVNNVKQYMDSPINAAAEAALRSIGKGLT
jgi:hypothetical protein